MVLISCKSRKNREEKGDSSHNREYVVKYP